MVVSLVGDGGFLMTGQEIATAFHHGVAPIVLVFNNQMYGTIRMHQERAHPYRVSGTALTNPDFAKYIEAFGGHGEVVSETEEFAPAFTRAVESGRPAVLELRMNPEQITTRATIADLRAGKPAPKPQAKPKRAAAAQASGIARRRQAGGQARLTIATPDAVYRLSHRFRVDADGRALPLAWMEQAARHYRAGEREAAARCCHAALQEQARDFDALHLLGVLETDGGRPAEAIDWLRRAIAVRPTVAQAHYHLGNALLAAERAADAVASFADALALQPEHVDALNNQGNALRNLGRFDEAIACYRAGAGAPAGFRRCALQSRPHIGRAAAAGGSGRESSRGAGRRHPGAAMRTASPTSMANWGARCWPLDRRRGGVGDLPRAAAPGCRTTRRAAWNESLALLQLGRYREAWPKYERRFAVPTHDAPRAGHHVLDLDAVAGKRVLLAAEQGRGDMIQFARYAPLLARRGAEVVVEAYPDLVALLRTLDGVADVVEPETDTPHDLLTSLLSLPMAFGTEVDSIPAAVPYLRAPAERVAAWRDRLGPRTRAAHRPRLVGVRSTSRNDRCRWPRWNRCCAGPASNSTRCRKRSRRRTCDWLAANPAAGPAHRGAGGFRRHRGADRRDGPGRSPSTPRWPIWPGALGTPVWIMLVARRRTGAGCGTATDSPWYPTARLFRRGAERDWACGGRCRRSAAEALRPRLIRSDSPAP